MLKQVVVAAASPRGIEGTHTYAYDALGRRMSKTVTPTGGSATTTVFVCAGQQVIAEYEGGAAATAPERKYIFCATGYIDEPIAMIDATSGGGSGEDTYYYHRNRQFSIVGLTDDTGTVIERYAYTAYGEVTVLDANAAADADGISDVLNSYTYTGRRLDDETGLLYFRARYHDPVLGRFLERDPLGYPDGLNTYAAYHVMRGGVDPMGLNQENTDILSVEHEFSKWKSTLDAKTDMFDKYPLGSIEHEFGKIMWVQAKVKMTTTALAAAGKSSWSLVKELPKLHPALRPLVTVTDIAIAASEGEEEFLQEITDLAVGKLMDRPKKAWKEILDRMGLADVDEFKDHVTGIMAHASNPHTVTRKHTLKFHQHGKEFETPTHERDCLRDWYLLTLKYDSSTQHDFDLFMMGEYCWKKDKCCYSCTLSVKGYKPDVTVRCAKTKSKCK